MQLVGHWYENREASVVAATIVETPLSVWDCSARAPQLCVRMTEVTFQICNMRPASCIPASGSELVAAFEVDVFPFRLRNCNIRSQPSGQLWVKLPGRREGGISILSPELIEAIREKALANYLEKFDGSRS
ncbi:hypothetical protein KX729_00215 [Rhizobium sp. XQZ8]|nr:hypothetical protein [Rhizobium populisoli]